ncbi:MAG: replication initiation factor domain-containing protein [Ruminiclostridium sp.]|nr:replication initiation factor domain-containing protein [Ruminiclostridium sp.]
MDYKIDWLTLTLKPVKDNVTYTDLHFNGDMCPLENWCFQFLEMSDLKGNFKKKQGSIQHYNTMYQYNGISVALSGPERFPEQGLMFRFSGDGIAYYEKYMNGKYSDWSWIKFLKEFFSLGVFGLTCKCTRIDLAFDDISYDAEKLIDLKTVATALKRGEFVSSFKSSDSITPFRLIPAYDEIKRNTKGEVLGETYYVGNRKSKVFLRFYDKLLECQAKKEDYDATIKHWVRMEFEFKDIRAMTVCDNLILLGQEEFGKYIAKVTNHYIRFVVPKGTRANYSRCNTRKWWQKIVGTVEKAKLVENKSYKNRYKSAYRWLKNYVFPTLFSVLHCVKIDVLLTDIRDSGIDHYDKNGKGSRHEQIVNDYFTEKDTEKYSGIDVHKLSCDEFSELLAGFNKTAYSLQMKKKAVDLCKSLSLDDAKQELVKHHSDELTRQYNILHKPARDTVRSMYNMNIIDFRNEKELLNDFPFSMYG